MDLTPESTETYYVFLASPGDMAEERDAVRGFFDRYNTGTGRHRGVRFQVIDYENHADIGVGRPQAIINRKTLERHRKHLALVVGLMGQRFGSPSGKAESGTEEEFELALSFHREHGWPEIKWFFREQPNPAFFPKDSTGMLQAAEQMKKVEAFRTHLKQGDPPLWYETFPTTADFSKYFEPDLENWLNAPDRPWNRDKTPPPATEPEAEEQDGPWFDKYLERLAEECNRLPLNLLKAEEYEAAPADVFVPLDVVQPPPRPDSEENETRHLARMMTRSEGDDRRPVFEALGEQRLLVLVGDPGSGKSTLVNRLTQRRLTGSETTESLHGLLPVRIILRRVQVPAKGEPDAAWIWQALEADVADRLKLAEALAPKELAHQAAHVCRRIKARAANSQGLLLMLDGLDEVSEAQDRRGRLLEAVQRLIDGLPEPNRVLVTARPYAYADTRQRLKGVPYSVLAPFDKKQLARFLRNWHRVERGAKGLSEAEAGARADDLIRRLQSRPEVQRLAERPLHASLIASLNLRGNRLPEDRCQLYEEIVDLLLLRWRSGESAFRDRHGRVMDLPESQIRPCLEELAYRAHAAQREDPDPRDAADIPRAMLERAFAPLLDHWGRLDLLDYLRRHAGILIGREEERFAFPHRAFQEYLAMRRLNARTDDALERTAATDPLWWREVFRLAVANQRKSPKQGIGLARDLLDRVDGLPAEQGQRVAVLVGLALLELDLDEKQRAEDTTHKRLRERLVTLIEDPDALEPKERLEAGLVLGRIGDPRPGEGLDAEGLPDIAWVEIPAGEFIFQKREKRELPTFHIARYPVTNAQFRAFLEAQDGHGNRAWWAGFEEKFKEPTEPGWSEGNCPRERVDWYQALAFCRWLSGKKGYEIRLPTEQEWERTARFTDGREYPWKGGFDRTKANVFEELGARGPNDLGRTSPVGIYPKGHSEEGVDDLSGNVWEWCSNKFEKPEVVEPDTSGDMRVVRGGSWLDLPELARAAVRYGSRPRSRGYDLGFRVWCAAPIRSDH